MTCVVGLVKGPRIVIGADSAGVYDYDLTVRADQKVFKNGPFIMGFAGSFRMGQLLKYAFDPPKLPDNDKALDRYMVTDFIDKVRHCLKDGGYAKKEDEVESTDGLALIGVHGRLFQMECDYQIGESAKPYDAIGCGDHLALGSLYSTSASLSPRVRVKKALEAAETFSAGVRGPFHYVELTG